MLKNISGAAKGRSRQTDGPVSQGTLLGGKLRYRQLQRGHRTGFEPVLLAAAVRARAGDAVLELGAGAGAGLLCLAQRMPGITGVGVEIEAELASLAAENFAINGFSHNSVVRADATALPFGRCFDHVFANPPWFDARGTGSPDPLRASARAAPAGHLALWVAAMAAALVPSGTLTMILPASALTRVQAMLGGTDLKTISILPLLPRLGRPPTRVILRAQQGPAATIQSSGLILHDANGITPEADAILRDGAALGR